MAWPIPRVTRPGISAGNGGTLNFTQPSFLISNQMIGAGRFPNRSGRGRSRSELSGLRTRASHAIGHAHRRSSPSEGNGRVKDFLKYLATELSEGTR